MGQRLKEGDDLGDLVIDGRMIVKWTLSIDSDRRD
jgi:hypothetical protein